MEYDNTDRGALFRNDRKESDKHPDFRGDINVGGTEYWISAWVKESKAGKKFFSLSVTAKDGQPSKPAQSKVETDDIPF